MLVEFSVENFKSIGKRQTLFMQPKTNKIVKQYKIKTGIRIEPYLLPAVAILGANASGKTNFIQAIRALDYIVATSGESQKGKELSVTPFKLNTVFQDQPTVFDISFIVNNNLYQYVLALTSSKIISEKLILKKIILKKHTDIVLIDRGEGKKFLNKTIHEDEKILEYWKSDINDQRTFLAFLGNKGKVTIFDDILKWFSDIAYLQASFSNIQKTSEMIKKNPELKKEIIALLSIADIQISDIEITEEKVELPSSIQGLQGKIAIMIAEEMGVAQDKVRGSIEGMKEVKTRLAHKAISGESIFFDFNEESSGTQELYALLGPILNFLSSGQLIIVDELERSFHPYLVRRIIQFFTSSSSNPNGAQLLFTTHDVTVLDERLLKPDQICFAEKSNTDLETSLYCLADFGGMSSKRERAKILKNYLDGLFGAVPQINWSEYNAER